jgi:hypothetical protein
VGVVRAPGGYGNQTILANATLSLKLDLDVEQSGVKSHGVIEDYRG